MAFFSMITGVMAANGMNILGAQIHTSTNGKVLDVLQVNSPQGFVVTDEPVEKAMRICFSFCRKSQVKSLVERESPMLLTERPKPRFPRLSRSTTKYPMIIRFSISLLHDKVGLLYRITSTLTALGLYIGVSKISTKVDQVADVFYVRDIFGHKIIDGKNWIRSRIGF
jgi:[protein-PII] uridylyltransferase